MLNDDPTLLLRREASECLGGRGKRRPQIWKPRRLALRRDPQGAQQANGYQSGFSFLALRAAFETQTAEHSNSKRRFAEYINGRDIVPGAAYAAPASSYWRCSIYAAIFQASFTPLMARCTTFTLLICCSPKQAPSASWTAAKSTSRVYVLHQAGAFFVTLASQTSMRTASTPRRPIERSASSPTRLSRWMVFHP
jgi:hypothetical protein